MTLCPLHHHEATVGAMPEKEQRSFKANPYNIERDYVEGMLKINQNILIVELGNVQFIGEAIS